MSVKGVFLIDLADWAMTDRNGYDFYELDRHMRCEFERLPAGSNVRLIVHKCRPYPGYTSWLRSDLNVQIEHSDTSAYVEWFEMLTDSEVAA